MRCWVSPSTLFPFRAVGVRPLSRCLPTTVAAAHSKCGLASCSLLVSRWCGGARFGDRARKGGRVELLRRSGPQKPRRGLSRFAPGSPPPSACEKPVWRGSACVGDPSAGFALAPVCSAWHDYATWGPTARRAEGQNRGGGFSPLATLAESSDRRVSGPSVERARLRGRGGSGSLYRRSLHGRFGSSSSRPSLQTHFGWRPAINSELARTRGIRLSN